MNYYYIGLEFILMVTTCFCNEFHLQKGYTIPNVMDKSMLITTKNLKSKTLCLSFCARLKNCEYVKIGENKCRFYSPFSRYLILQSSNSYEFLYKKSITKNLSSLKFYWPIYDSSVNDIVSGQNLYNPVNTTFVIDRFGASNSALKFNNGYYRIPPGYYFEENFTIIIIAKPYENKYVSFFDFGCEGPTDNLLLMTYGSLTKLKLDFYFGNNGNNIFSNQDISIGFWNHLALVRQNQNISIYVNGTKDVEKNYFSLRNQNRTSNFLGGNNWADYFKGELDDFKIYNKALSENEIIEEFDLMMQIY